MMTVINVALQTAAHSFYLFFYLSRVCKQTSRAKVLSSINTNWQLDNTAIE